MKHILGDYFALSYRKQVVCIDSGLERVLANYIQRVGDSETLARIDYALSEFLKDYTKVFYGHPDHGGHQLEKLTTWFNYAERSICLTPHYKVPNATQSLGCAPLLS